MNEILAILVPLLSAMMLLSPLEGIHSLVPSHETTRVTRQGHEAVTGERSYRQLTVEDVLAGLRQRDQDLSMFEVRLTEGGWWRDPDMPNLRRDVEPGSPDSMTVTTWRRGEEIASTFSWSPSGNVAVGSGGHSVWSPSRHGYRCFIPSPLADGLPTAVVQSEQPDFAESTPSGIFYFEMLGLYSFRPEGSKTYPLKVDEKLTHWFERQRQNNRVEVEAATWEGSPAVLVRVRPNSDVVPRVGVPTTELEYYFSPEKDYMLLAEHFVYTSLTLGEEGQEAGAVRSQMDTLARVVRAEPVDGVWVPLEVRLDTTDTEHPNRVQGQVWVAQSFARTEPDPKDFLIDFPTGCTVLDYTNEVAYDIVKPGVIRPARFLASSDSGITTSPPALVRRSLEQFPPYEGFVLKTLLPTEQAAATPAAPLVRPAGGGNGLLLVLIAGGGLVLAVFVFMAIRSSTRFSGNKSNGGQP